MIFHVMDTDFTLRGEIVRFTSMRIARERAGAGAFEMHLTDREAASAGVALGRIIFPVRNPERAAIIQSVERTEGTDEVSVTGVTLAGLTARRIVLPGEASAASYGYDRIIADAESVIKHYAEANMIAPADEKRRMACMEMEENLHRGMRAVPWSARYEALDRVLAEAAAYADAGYDIVPDFEKKKLLFRYRPGNDLTGETDARRVTFSTALGNAERIAYLLDARSEKTTAYIGGSGEDEKREIYAEGTDATGIERREMFVDAGSAQGVDELKYEGRRKIGEAARVQSLTCEVLDAGPMRYGEDWDVGDLVNVTGAGAQMQVRITRVEESHDAGRARALRVTFGEARKGITEIIRGMKNAKIR